MTHSPGSELFPAPDMIEADRQRDARTHAEAYEGRLRTDRDLRRELWARLGGVG